MSTSIDLHSVAFIALVSNKLLLSKSILEINKLPDYLSDYGVRKLHFYTQVIKGQEVILAILDLDSTVESKATEIWTTITTSPLLGAAFQELNLSIEPHPRLTERYQTPWLKMESICKIRPNNTSPSQVDQPCFAAVTGLKKEKEAEYRLLHNNVWPGVIEAIGDSNIPRFDIFLVELGENQPYLFYQFQYSGEDFDQDMAAQSESPVNQRWWKFTDNCQFPLHDSADSPWLDLVKH